MRRPARVVGHRLLPPERAAQPGVPIRVEALRGLGRHPRGEPLVQPQVVPPRHRDQVAEPLVRDLVRDDAVDLLLLAQRRLGLVVQQAGLVVVDRAPVLHRAENAARHRHLVELRQGIANAEILVEERHDLLGRLHCVARAAGFAPDGIDAKRDAVDAVLQDLQLADEQRHQISRHGQRAGKGHFLLAAGQGRDRGHRHVRDRGQRLVDYRRDLEAGAKHGLVPAREEPARVHRLHVGGEHDLVDQLAVLALLVAHLVQALRVPRDPARIVDVEPIAAGGDRARRGRQRDSLALPVEFRRKAR